MTGEELLFLTVVWLLAGVPLALRMGSFVGFGRESEGMTISAARGSCDKEAA